MDRNIAEIPDHLGDIYDAALTLASFLDQDNSLRKEEEGNVTRLTAQRRRRLETLVVGYAPWLRSFPSLRALDDELNKYFGTLPDRMGALRLAEMAGSTQVISQDDRKLLVDLLSALEREGALSEKAGKRGLANVKTLVWAVTAVVSFYAGAVQSDFGPKSELVRRASDFLVQSEETVLSIIEHAAPDLRHSALIAIDQAKRNRGGDGVLPQADPIRRDDDEG